MKRVYCRKLKANAGISNYPHDLALIGRRGERPESVMTATADRRCAAGRNVQKRRAEPHDGAPLLTLTLLSVRIILTCLSVYHPSNLQSAHLSGVEFLPPSRNEDSRHIHQQITAPETLLISHALHSHRWYLIRRRSSISRISRRVPISHIIRNGSVSTHAPSRPRHGWLRRRTSTRHQHHRQQ